MKVQHLSVWEDFSPSFEYLCAISGSYWFERYAYSLCKIDVSSSVLAPVSLMSWCSLSLCSCLTCCSFSSFSAIPDADRGRIRCLISLCSLRHTCLHLGTGGRAACKESNPCLSVRFSALRAAWARAGSEQAGQNFLDTFLFQMPVHRRCWKPSLYYQIWNNFSFRVRSKNVYFQKTTQCRQLERTCLKHYRKANKL